MGLRIIVTVKQVPDTHDIKGEAMNPDGTVNRAVLPAIFNPEDLNALEEALKLKETVGASVTALTMGPPKALEVLRECLFRGADNAVLVTDRRFAGSDTLATSYVLKCAIDKLGAFDLIFCGRQAIDGDTAQVGPQLAEKLGINQITCVSAVSGVDGGRITARRTVDDGMETVASRLPVLLTVTATANQPRTASAKRMLAFKSIGVKACGADYGLDYLAPDTCQPDGFVMEWDLDAIGADPKLCGFAGSPTRVKKVDSVVLTASQARRIEPTDAGIAALVRELIDENILG